MRRTLLLIVTLLTAGTMAFSQGVVYVRWNAPGNDDGSSWMDAYRDLQDALDNASEGDSIWIAAGTYYPGGFTPDTLSTFYINKSISLFGGFAGNEGRFSERDRMQHVSHLSGDLARNDIDGDLVQNRSDNAQHVVTVEADSTDVVTFDGLAITGGHTSDNGNLPLQFYSGGGILAFSPLAVVDCRFSANFGRTGGCIAIVGSSEIGSTIRNCRFHDNGGTSQSAGVFMSTQKNGLVEGCEFVDNNTNRGVLYLLDCDDMVVRNCRFATNVNSAGFGGAFYNWNCVNTLLTDCEFVENQAANAAGIYIDGRDDRGHGITVRNCVFRQNTTGGRGGAIRGATARYSVVNCLFENNTASSTGAGIHASTDNYTVDSCTFFGNVSGWGPAVTTYNEGSVGVISNSTFENNQALTSGGAVSNGFKARVRYENNVFLNNRARFGGAMYIQNDTTTITVDNCEFSGNSAETGGGFFNGAGAVFSFENCEFVANSAEFGAGVHISDTDSDLTEYQYKNCVFNFNLASAQGGGANINNANGLFENCLFINNFADGLGVGAGIAVNASSGQSANTSLVNCTVAENYGLLASGISQWTEAGTASFAELSLQNNIFQTSDGLNYAIEDGAPTVVSLGGNLCAEVSLSTLLTHPADVINSASFKDPDNDDYHLAEGSAAINIGVAAGAPDTDLDGNERDDMPDAGAYEYQGSVGIELFAKRAVQLDIYPNPVREQLHIELPADWTGSATWLITDLSGRHIRSGKTDVAHGQIFQVETTDLKANNYHILFVHEKGRAIANFVKI